MLILLILLIGLFGPKDIIIAQEASTPTTISVTPSVLRLDLSEETPEAIIFYKNTTDSAVELQFSAQDFTELEAGWKVKFLNDAEAKSYNYSLSSWIAFERTSMTLDPGEQRSLKVFIDAKRLTPGGHYASIQAEIKQPETAQDTVQLRGILSSLLFVRTSTGQELEQGEIDSLEVSKNLFSLPSQLKLKFQNLGNVDLTPYGLITITDSLNRKIGTGVLNEDSHTTLPSSIRRYDIPIKQTNQILLPGFYTTEVQLKYGKDEIRISKSVTNFSFGNITLPILSLLLLLTFLKRFRTKKLETLAKASPIQTVTKPTTHQRGRIRPGRSRQK